MYFEFQVVLNLCNKSIIRLIIIDNPINWRYTETSRNSTKSSLIVNILLEAELIGKLIESLIGSKTRWLIGQRRATIIRLLTR